MINFIEYKNLPSNFWDKVIYYEYFVSFSGFVKDEPCITFWTSEGKVYYLNISELRDGRFERVIPFFESMTNQKKIDQGDLFYFNWRLIPKGWKCYQEPGLHCFMPKAVYKDFRSRYERMKNEKPKEDVEYIISIFNRWKIALKQSYQDIYGCKINEDEKTCIRLNEKMQNTLSDSKHKHYFKNVSNLKQEALKFRASGTLAPSQVSRWNNVCETYRNLIVVNGVNEALEEIEQKIELIKDELDRKSNEIQNYIATFIAVFGLISIVASVLTIVDLVGGGTNKIQAALEISCIGIAAFVVSWVVMMMKSGNRR